MSNCLKVQGLISNIRFSLSKLVSSYPVVARTLRDYHAKKAGQKVEPRSHQCCGIGMKEGLGYSDLDELMNTPQNLQFTIGKCFLFI